MKSARFLFASSLLYALLACHAAPLKAQAIAPEKSARAAAMSDTRFIAKNIQDNQDEMNLMQKAIDHSGDARIKELAQQMIADHTELLYALQELKAAGSGASDNNELMTDDTHIQASRLLSKLSGVSGSDFDTMWVANVLTMHQVKLDELTQAKATVTNPQLKMAVTEAIPIIRKHNSQLRVIQKNLTKMLLQRKKQAQ